MSKIVASFVIFLITNSLFGRDIIENIYIERHNVFDSTEIEEFFAAPLFNSLHVKTRPYVIEDELLFAPDDYIYDEELDETERNLRKTGLFTKAKIELEHVEGDRYNVYVVTQDRWSTEPSALLGTGGGYENYGARLREVNLFGTGVQTSVEALYRGENGIGMQGAGEVFFRRFFRTDYEVFASVIAHQYRTEQEYRVAKPYRNLRQETSYGASGKIAHGYDFLYEFPGEKEKLSFQKNSANAYFSKAFIRGDRMFVTAFLELEDLKRTKPEYAQAYDNSGKLLFSFSSVAQDFATASKLNNYFTEDIAVGGYGRAILGKTFAIGSRGESVYYLGAEGEKSYYDEKLYLFGRVRGGSAIIKSQARYTYQEFLGLGFYRLSEYFLIAARARQQTAWNWDKARQLILDSDGGLRGYNLNEFAGENRILANIEARYFSDLEVLFAKISGAAFFDIGTVWNQNEKLYNKRIHNSAGLGLRIHFLKSYGVESVFRIDFAYNFDEGKFGGIIFTSDQLFSIFQNHDYKIPEIFGMEYDYE